MAKQRSKRAGVNAAILVLTTAILTTITVDVAAQPPSEGTFRSTDIGGTMLPARLSESWKSVNGFNEVGNTVNVESWGGTDLGDQWRAWCAAISSPPILLVDTIDQFGNGIKVWHITYLGGMLWLGDGPWDAGGAPYNGLMDEYLSITTEQYIGNKRVAVNCNLSFSATIVGYPNSCMTFAVGNCVGIGSTTTIGSAADYPELIDADCVATATHGQWGDVKGITLSVTGCNSVPVSETTWGAVKVLYQ